MKRTFEYINGRLVEVSAGVALAVGSAASQATSLIDYSSVVTTATAEVTAAIAAGVVFFGLIRGAKAGMAFIKSMLSGR